MNPILIFHNHLRDSDSLLKGRLVLIDADTSKILNTYIATSGLPNWQSADETNLVGKGSIPETIKVGATYHVDTVPVPLPGVKGVEGNFYRIIPYIVLVDGIKRSDLGIHRDANVPGSSGCIVLTTSTGWLGFEADMCKLAKIQLASVPLIVSYSK